MKYIYLIIRHCFPRRRWTEVEKISFYGNNPDLPQCFVTVQRDQFGNMRTFKVSA
jgi:hypothetical protein